jgi:hypothetical protein
MKNGTDWRRICFHEVNGFPKDIDELHKWLAAETSSRRRDFGSSGRRGGVSKITRKNSNSNTAQKRRAAGSTRISRNKKKNGA